MATVYRAHDQLTGATVALKHLHCEQEERQRERVTRLFQHEYLTLVELAHPRIVKVFEYGIVDGSPYYTMELLDGADLKSATMPWRKASSVLRDIASALAVIHSRRLVHRDVTPRNVRCTLDGRAKLIDFGALSPMGEPVALVGTPPFVAPEMLNRQPLDGRTDLYSLGALAYRLLTGRHAYLARTMEELPARWRVRPESPSKLVPDVPQALSALVLSMLSFEPLGRPTTAWEVIERLSAIAELPPEEESRTARAYLITPTLVGRDHEQAEFRGKLDAALDGRGSVVWIKGAPGSGRSRLLGSLMLESRLKGVPVLRADGSEGRDGELAVARSLARDVEATKQTIDLELGEAFVPWLLELSKEHGLVVAVDDVQRVDSASAALLGKLVQAAPQHRLVLALTLCPDEEDAAWPWLSMLGAAAPPLEAQPLTEEQTEALMRSVFGDAAHLRPLSHLLHRLASGNPGTCMSLAQHLLERGAVHYESGRWVLPSDPHAIGLSDNVLELFSGRIEPLRPAARELSAALALVDPAAPISRDHYHLLVREELRDQIFFALNELTTSNILRARGDTDVFTHPVLVEALRRSLSETERRALHLRIAKIYEALPDQHLFTLAWHLQQGGEHERACELLVKESSAANSNDMLARGLVPRTRGHYRFGRAAYETALSHAEQAHAPCRTLFELRRSLVYLAVYSDPKLLRHALPVIEQLKKDSGLVYLSTLSENEGPTAKIWRCIELAQRAYDAASEHERCYAPAEAIRALAHLVGVLAGAHSRILDVDALDTLPPLIAPLRALVPPLDYVAETVQSCCDASLGFETRARCLAVIERIESDPGSHDNEIMLAIVHALRYYVGVWEARYGGERGLSRADEIERDMAEWEQRFPYHGGLGRYRSWHVRLLSHLYNGDLERARACREKIELLQLDGLDPLVIPNMQTGVYMEARAHALIGSLPELRDAIDVISGLSDSMPTWRPVLHWVRGEYQRLREDYAGACMELERALALVPSGRHLVWPWAAGSLAEALLASGNVKRAHDVASSALKHCAALPLQLLTRVDLERVLALTEAHLGSTGHAARRLARAIAAIAPEAGGVPMGRLYETRAQIALLASDAKTFEKYVGLTDQHYRRGGHPALIARCEKLVEQGRQQGLETTPRSGRSTAKLSRSK